MPGKDLKLNSFNNFSSWARNNDNTYIICLKKKTMAYVRVKRIIKMQKIETKSSGMKISQIRKPPMTFSPLC